MFYFIDVMTLQSTISNKSSQVEELQTMVEKNEVELKIQREKVRKLKIKIQEMEETRKTSSLVLQDSSDIIPLSGCNNYNQIFYH